MAGLNTIIGWFTTGKKPTGEQFAEAWSSFFHKDENIPQGKVQDLTNTLNNKADKSQVNGHIGDENAHGLHDKLAAKADVAALNALAGSISNKANVGHTHELADVNGLTGALAGKANTAHTHELADINGLTGALAGKSSNGHSHAISEVTGLTTALDGKLSKGANPAYEKLDDTSEKYGLAFLSRLGAVFRSSKVKWDETLSKLTIAGSQALWEATPDVTDGNMGVKVLDDAQESFKLFDSFGNFFSTGIISGKRLFRVFTPFRLVNGVANNETEFKAGNCDGNATTLIKSIDIPLNSMITIDVANIGVMNIDKATITGFAQFALQNDAGVITDISDVNLKYGRQHSRIKAVAGYVGNTDTRFDFTIVGTAVKVNFVNTENKLVNAHCEIKYNVTLFPVAL